MQHSKESAARPFDCVGESPVVDFKAASQPILSLLCMCCRVDSDIAISPSTGSLCAQAEHVVASAAGKERLHHQYALSSRNQRNQESCSAKGALLVARHAL